MIDDHHGDGDDGNDDDDDETACIEAYSAECMTMCNQDPVEANIVVRMNHRQRRMNVSRCFT